ncbi:hypothetical protein Tco_1476475 [Tanacetum coccineum]
MKAKDNERRSGKREEPKALVTLDGDGVDWTSHSEDEQENYALMASAIQAQTLRNKAGTGMEIKRDKGVLSYENKFGSILLDLIKNRNHVITYGPKQSKPSESNARSSDFNSCESNSSEETLESMLEPVVNEPKVVSQAKVSSDAPIIEEYESDSDDDCATTTSTRT